MVVIPFPMIDPVAIQLGPVAVRWYGLAYVVSFLWAGWFAQRLVRRYQPKDLVPGQVDSFLLYAVIGVVVGGRLGQVLFYKAGYFMHHPIEIFQVWRGGMSFHGGALGLLAAALIFCYRHKTSFWALVDVVAVVAPIGLGLGRVANFINQEVYGLPTTVSWAVVFPHVDSLPRHPTQLYEAAIEGVLLFIILRIVYHIWHKRLAMTSALFAVVYAIGRMMIEPLKETTPIWGDMSMEVFLCLLLMLLGMIVFARAVNAPADS